MFLLTARRRRFLRDALGGDAVPRLAIPYIGCGEGSIASYARQPALCVLSARLRRAAVSISVTPRTAAPAGLLMPKPALTAGFFPALLRSFLIGANTWTKIFGIATL